MEKQRGKWNERIYTRGNVPTLSWVAPICLSRPKAPSGDPEIMITNGNAWPLTFLGRGQIDRRLLFLGGKRRGGAMVVGGDGRMKFRLAEFSRSLAPGYRLHRDSSARALEKRKRSRIIRVADIAQRFRHVSHMCARACSPADSLL